MRYAKEGYAFYHVRTPRVFLEYVLPQNTADYTREDCRHWRELEDLAEIHNTPIMATTYRIG